MQKLCALDDVKTFIGETGSSQDTDLNTLIDRASAIIQLYCDRDFELQTYTDELYDGTGTNILYLRQYPIDQNTTPSISTRTGITWTAETNVGTYLDFNDATRQDGMIHWMDGRGFPYGRRNIKITYKAGYATTANSLPEDIQHAAVLMTHALYMQWKSGLHIAPSLTQVDGQTIVMRDEPIPSAVEIIISRYRRMSEWYG